MLKSSVVKTVNFFLLAQKKYIRKQSTIECTRYASVRRILRNSTFSRQAAKCERAVCKQSIASPAENRCNQKKPSTTPLKWCWASFCTPKTTRLASGSKEASADGEKSHSLCYSSDAVWQMQTTKKREKRGRREEEGRGEGKGGRSENGDVSNSGGASLCFVVCSCQTASLL